MSGFCDDDDATEYLNDWHNSEGRKKVIKKRMQREAEDKERLLKAPWLKSVKAKNRIHSMHSLRIYACGCQTYSTFDGGPRYFLSGPCTPIACCNVPK